MADCKNVAQGGKGMGLGRLGDPDLIIKRKFRWTFEIILNCSGAVVPSHFCKIANRPDLTIDETELNFLNSKKFIPGKATWEQMNVTYIDVATKDNVQLWNFIANVYDFTSDCRFMNSRPQDYAGTGVLKLYDGNGNAVEQWDLENMWATNIKFGDLSMEDTGTVDIEMTLRYDNATFTPFCGGTIKRCVGPACAA